MKHTPILSPHDINYLNGTKPTASCSPGKNSLQPALFDSKQTPNPKGANSVTPSAPSPGHYPFKVFPEAMRQMIAYIAQHYTLPATMVATATLAIVSACLGRKFKTKLSSYDDPTLCNLFVLLGSETASGKGIIGMLLKAVISAQTRMTESHRLQQNKLEIRRDMAKGVYKRIQRQLVKIGFEGFENDSLFARAEELHNQIHEIERELKRSYEFCLRHPTGAALRKSLMNGDQSVFLFSLDGGSILKNVFTSSDDTLRRFILSGFSGEQTGSETGSCGSYGGEPCLSFLFAVQPYILYELLFNQKAAEAGLLNRPIVIDANYLEYNNADPILPKASEAISDWTALINSLLDFRFSDTSDKEKQWCRQAERLFDDFEGEVSEILETWPDSAREHSGRAKELAVRIAGVFLAVETLHGNSYCISSEKESSIAEGAISLMRWFFCHRLQIQKDAYYRHLASVADQLEDKLKRKNGMLAISRIKDSHPQIYRQLSDVLTCFPDRFNVIEQRKGNTGPQAKTVILNT